MIVDLGLQISDFKKCEASPTMSEAIGGGDPQESLRSSWGLNGSSMNDPAYLQILRVEPDNDVAREAYWNWLEETDDHRAPYVRLMRQRTWVEKELKEIDLRLHVLTPSVSEAWLDIAFPLRVRSSMVGRCWVRPLPDAAPYVRAGSHVKPDTVVCMIEVLKTFHEVTAGFQGVVTEIAVANGDPVEYNQVLFRISRPSLDFW
jgi:uncharacterized protein (TIGR02996 family)